MAGNGCSILTEAGDALLTEAGDFLMIEGCVPGGGPVAPTSKGGVLGIVRRYVEPEPEADDDEDDKPDAPEPQPTEQPPAPQPKRKRRKKALMADAAPLFIDPATGAQIAGDLAKELLRRDAADREAVAVILLLS